MKKQIIDLSAISIPETLLLFASILADRQADRDSLMNIPCHSTGRQFHYDWENSFDAYQTWKKMLWKEGGRI